MPLDSAPQKTYRWDDPLDLSSRLSEEERMVWEAARAVSIPINGIGGISTWEDAAEMILAGATAVTVGTANLVNPTASLEVLRGLEAWAAEQGVSDINELVGAMEC